MKSCVCSAYECVPACVCLCTTDDNVHARAAHLVVRFVFASQSSVASTARTWLVTYRACASGYHTPQHTEACEYYILPTYYHLISSLAALGGIYRTKKIARERSIGSLFAQCYYFTLRQDILLHICGKSVHACTRTKIYIFSDCYYYRQLLLCKLALSNEHKFVVQATVRTADVTRVQKSWPQISRVWCTHAHTLRIRRCL